MGQTGTVLRNALHRAKPESTVQVLDLMAYKGRWYQWRATPNFFQRTGARNVIAEYTGSDDPMVVFQVDNYEPHEDGADVKHIHGRAYRNADFPVDQGKFMVKFDMPLLEFEGAYWVFAISAVIDGRYQWAVVGDQQLAHAWVLVRSPSADATTLAEIDAAIARIDETHPFAKLGARLVQCEHDDFWYRRRPIPKNSPEHRKGTHSESTAEQSMLDV